MNEQAQAEVSVDHQPAPRISFKCRVTYKPGKRTNQEGMIRDLSESGAFLVTREALLVDTEVLLYLTFVMNGREKTCFISGKVVRMEKKPGVKPVGHGIQFEANRTAMLNTLREFIDTQLPPLKN